MKHRNVAVIFFAIALNHAGYGQSVPASQTAVPATAGSSVGAPAATAPPRVHRHAKRPTISQKTENSRLHATRGNQGDQRAKGDINVKQPALSFSVAAQRHRHERHNRTWWKRHYTTIVFVTGGYYYWDAGYWFPAFGYDPVNDNYDYDGPIYTYSDLLPDQVIINVQRALKQLGYYAGGLTGSLGPSSRAALAAYQEDAGLEVTGAIDAPTVEALGLY